MFKTPSELLREISDISQNKFSYSPNHRRDYFNKISDLSGHCQIHFFLPAKVQHFLSVFRIRLEYSACWYLCSPRSPYSRLVFGEKLLESSSCDSKPHTSEESAVPWEISGVVPIWILKMYICTLPLHTSITKCSENVASIVVKLRFPISNPWKILFWQPRLKAYCKLCFE